MTYRIDIETLKQLWRYYQAGVVNALFGFCTFALLVAAGLNIFGAQILAHILGVAFNYLTYSRHAFRGSAPAKTRFILSYIGNYFVSLVALLGATHVVASPYIAGLMAIIVTSIINYFSLRYLVFTRAGTR